MYSPKSGENLELLAPAKLNLFLELLARRDDGFHEIETLMVAINIFDTIRISARSDRQLELSCHWAGGFNASSTPVGLSYGWPTLPTERDNLVWQAMEKLRSRAGIELGATIEVIKRIPAAVGLGGASSDAAAALIVANELWRLRWSATQLAEVAADLGSDVPFLLAGGAAVCRGRGERMESVTQITRMDFVVVQPPGGLSTKQVYQHSHLTEKPCRVDRLLAATQQGRLSLMGKSMFNRLQEPAAQLSPWINRTRREFQNLDVCGHQMSGSGTSYFGLCRNARHARRIANRLRGRIAGTVFCAHSLPSHRRR